MLVIHYGHGKGEVMDVCHYTMSGDYMQVFIMFITTFVCQLVTMQKTFLLSIF